MELRAFLELLQGVKPNGQGYEALCPAHNDKNPSLSVSEGEDGRILLKCFGGCSYDDILKAMGLVSRDLFAPNSDNGGVKSAAKKRKQLEPEPIGDVVVEKLHEALSEKARDYLRGERMLTDEVINQYQLGIEERSGEKRITIPIRDAQGRVRDIRRWLPPADRTDNSQKILHWKAGYGATRLYPIDQLENDELVLCEGELDALALIAHGVSAITTTCGVSTWPDSLSEAFAGKTVTVCMDHDAPGEKGAQKRAESLCRYDVKVRLAPWPR